MRIMQDKWHYIPDDLRLRVPVVQESKWPKRAISTVARVSGISLAGGFQ